METVVHVPVSQQDRAEIKKRLARIHAQFVLSYLEQLTCPQWQKEKLLEAVIDKLQAAGRPADSHGAGL